MNKVITINLNGKAYQLEEDGFVLLKRYLDEAETNLANNPDKTEIMKDFEQAIADKSEKHLDKDKNVITKSEIEQIIKDMGPVEDPEKSEKSETKKENTSIKKKLYRDPDNVMIAGVASGLAAYFGVDITLMRIVMAVTVFFWGGGFVLYILLWLLIPMAETSAEKLEMRGDKVTLSNLQETVKEKLSEPGSKVGNFLSKLFALIIRIIGGVFKIALVVIGGFTAFGATIAAIGATMLTAVLLSNRNSPYIDPTVSEVFTGSMYYLVIVLAYLALILPLVMLVLIGVSILRNKSAFKTMPTIGITVIWFAAAVVLTSVMFRAAPRIEAIANTNHPTVTKTLELKDFDRIDAGGEFIVNISQGTTYSVKLTGEEKYIDDGEIIISERTLITKHQDRFRICLFCFSRPMTLDITMPALTAIDGHGASEIKASKFTTDDFILDLSGVSSADLDLTVKNLDAELSGASKLNIIGTADKLSADISGVSQINARNFQVKSAIVEASGASDAYLNVSESIEVDASGASNVRYSGNPQTKIDSSGSSEVDEF